MSRVLSLGLITLLLGACTSVPQTPIRRPGEITALPSEWVRAANSAWEDFASRHDNPGCYDILFRIDDADHLRVSFSPPQIITTSGEQITLQHENCGAPGETCEFDESFELVDHWYARH
jgi:hypothetical protein